MSALRTLPVWADQKWVFVLLYPSLSQYRSSFLLSVKPVVWRPAHGSNDASGGQPGSPPAACFSDRCAGWKQPPKPGPRGILSNLSASSVLVPTQSGDVVAQVAQVGKTQARYPASNSSLRRSAASVEIGAFGNELWLTLQVFLFLDGSWDWALVAATCRMSNGWFCFGVKGCSEAGGLHRAFALPHFLPPWQAAGCPLPSPALGSRGSESVGASVSSPAASLTDFFLSHST